MRKFLSRSLIVLTAAVGAGVYPPTASADDYSLPIGTIGNEPAWMVSLDGVAWYSPFQATPLPGVPAIGVQQDLKGLQSMFPWELEPAIGGLDLTNWNGMWAAKYQFYIPSWASDIHLHINSVSVDDKAAVFVDSFPVGFFALNDKTGTGTFQFADDPNNEYAVNYVSSLNFPSWGWDKELMTGWNTIEVYVDNTDSQDLSDLSQTNIYGTRLYTYLSLDATVSYIPEPGAWILLATVAGLCIVHRIHMRR